MGWVFGFKIHLKINAKFLFYKG